MQEMTIQHGLPARFTRCIVLLDFFILAFLVLLRLQWPAPLQRCVTQAIIAITRYRHGA